MTKRKGLGKGKGKGFFNIIGADPNTHSLSAKGIKQPQKMNIFMAKPQDSDGDGVSDIMDCDPNDPNKQHIINRIKADASLSDIAHKMQFELRELGYDVDVDVEGGHLNVHNVRISEERINERGRNFDSISRKKTRILGWDDWVEVNDKINEVMDDFDASGNIKSQGGFVIREGKESMTEDDWFEFQTQHNSRIESLEEPEFYDPKTKTYKTGKQVERLNFARKAEISNEASLKLDRDGDGILDAFDCDPDDPTKQDDFEVREVGDFLARQKSLAPTSADAPVSEIEFQAVPEKPSLVSRAFEAGKKAGAGAFRTGKSLVKTAQEQKAELHSMSGSQLKEKAIATQASAFGNNRYEQELLRRIKAKKRLDEKISKEEAKQPTQNLFG